MAANPKPVKLRKCKVCREWFPPWNTLQPTCGIRCAMAFDKVQKAKKARIEKRDGRLRLMTRSDHMALTQKAFNAWIRERDKNRPCISCGRFNPPERFTGGVWDCGHYRTVGAAPELRFEEKNAHKQCKTCNSGVRRAGKSVRVALDPERAATIRGAYKLYLIERIGKEAVDWLEGPHEPKKYTVDELIAIRSECVRKRKNSLLAALA